MHMQRPWFNAIQNRTLVRYSHKRDEYRIGHCDFKPSDGDVCMVVAHSGDGFHDYVALRSNGDGTWSVAGEFGAYGFGDVIGTADKRTFHLAQAGEPVKLEWQAQS